MVSKLKQRRAIPIVHKTELNRAQFLKVMDRTTPEVFQDLRKNVTPIFDELIGRAGKSSRAIHFRGEELPFPRIGWRKFRRLPDVFKGDPDALSEWPDEVHSTITLLKEALSSWAGRFQINRPWVIQRALQALAVGGDPKGGMIEALTAISFDIEAWDSEAEPKSVYERRASREFRTFLTNYTERMQEVIPNTYLAQLALYLCRNMKLNEVATIGTPLPLMDTTTVYRHVKTAATALGLSLRKPGKVARL